MRITRITISIARNDSHAPDDRRENTNRLGQCGPGQSGTFQESKVEGCEYEDDSYVHHQPSPESVLEEQKIDRNDHGSHQDYVKCSGLLLSISVPNQHNSHDEVLLANGVISGRLTRQR